MFRASTIGLSCMHTMYMCQHAVVSFALFLDSFFVSQTSTLAVSGAVSFVFLLYSSTFFPLAIEKSCSAPSLGARMFVVVVVVVVVIVVGVVVVVVAAAKVGCC